MLVVADMDRTLSREEDGFAVRDKVAAALNELTSRHSFAVVTGRREETAMRLAGRLRPTAWVLEGGAIILYGSRRIVAAPADWSVRRESVVAQLRSRGYRCSLGEVAIYVDGVPSDPPRGTQIAPNRGSAIVLPEGIDKGFGVRALKEAMGYRGKVVAIGDGENDLAMFEAADVKVAVANAVEELKRAADIVLSKEDGDGVLELVRMLEDLPQLR
ncbi:MAG: HAD family hydrolase [Conexivisphaera sp.]